LSQAVYDLYDEVACLDLRERNKTVGNSAYRLLSTLSVPAFIAPVDCVFSYGVLKGVLRVPRTFCYIA